jgi:tripartite-type tricarboxylate transporter receptor subunit TctC
LQKTSYDPIRDFAPVTLMSRAPNLLVVHPSVPVKSVKDLIALAKAKPGELNYASASVGSSPHLAPELFKAMADINIVRVPYKGSAQGLMDVLAGQVQLMFPVSAGAAPHVASGKLRALAITTPKPSPLFPELPTVAASGVPGYESGTINAMFAPVRTPEAIINRLNREVVLILRRAEIREKFLSIGVEPAGTSPEELTATVKSEMARLGKVIRDAGIKPE